MGPINLEKIRQVHQEMMRRHEEFEADKQLFELADEAKKPRAVSVNKVLELYAEHAGMNAHTLKTRVRRGVPLKDAVRIPVQNTAIGAKTIVTLREQAMTLAEWARHFGVSINTVLSRLRMGWDVEKVLMNPPMRPGGRKSKVAGGWSETSLNGLGTGGGGSLDNVPKQDFFQ